ncbi:hypothetical protein BC332_24183 [Capsicum chinense]|nr:hypothetical protein BC332_24183 [Capsicum chinense]
MNKIFFIPCVLGPHHKFVTLDFALKKIFGEKASTIEKDVQEYMKSFFDKYSKSTSKDKGGKLSSTDVEASISISMVMKDIGYFYEELSRHTSGSGTGNSKSELDKYLRKDIKVGKPDFSVFLWWKYNSTRFPFLSKMARDIRSESQLISIEEHSDSLKQLEQATTTTIKPKDYTHSPVQERIADKITILLDRRDNHNRETPLHLVVHLTDVYAAKVLVVVGADILLQNADGWNVLQEAIMQRCSDVVSILV